MHFKIHSSQALPSARLCSRLIMRALAIIGVTLSAGICLAQTEPAPGKKEEKLMIRIICVQSLTEKEEETTLATKAENGNWIEHGTVTLRTPFITEWIPATHDTIHLIRKDSDKIISLGSFLIPPQTKRAIVVLLPIQSKNEYRAQVIDPQNLEFKKGKVLILNYGQVPAMVKIGSLTVTVKPGQQVVERIDADKEGMYQLRIGYLDKEKNIVPCYDRYVSSNPKTRKFILLFPDQESGLRAMSLSEFGPFE